MNQPEPLTCVLCHVTDRDVAIALIRHVKDGRLYFSTDPRCRDRDACRKRAEDAALPWPLVAEPQNHVR